MHLFDIDFPGKITFKESDSLTGGSELATVTIGDIKIGLGICYDIRFDELAKLYRKEGCNMLIYPGAFNLTTGPIHWELLGRARAMDSQCYVAVCSLARDVNFSYVAWGHSMLVDPWAKVISKAGPFEEVIFGEIGKKGKIMKNFMRFFKFKSFQISVKSKKYVVVFHFLINVVLIFMTPF